MINVIIHRDITRPQCGIFPRGQSRIRYDSKAARAKKMHCLLYQQGKSFGEVGDMCDYLTHAELLWLEKEGVVTIHGMKRTRD